MWFLLAIIAFFLLAIAVIVDKFLLSKTAIVPLSFAFYISFFGGLFCSFFIFFESHFYFPKEQLVAVILGGSSLFFGLYFMFIAISRSEVSKTNALIVSLIPVVVFLFSLIMSLEMVSLSKIIGVALIIVGGYLLSQVGLQKTKLNKKTWFWILLSSLMLGLSNAFSKIAYDNLSFITAFVWLRWLTLIAGLLFVLFTNQWQQIFKTSRHSKQPWKPFIFGQLAGSLGVIFLQYAIKLGNVILVTALNGVQFFFVILLVYFLSKFHPQILKEDIRTKFISQKIFWSIILFIGIMLILV